MKPTSLEHLPIGIFDSGIGGLTVAKAIRQLMPQENLIYFGDTAHLPYGDKSATAIQAYSIKICNFLLVQNCKVILIACYSASVAAYELVKEYIGTKAKVFNVIDPIIQHLQNNYHDQQIGLIGTRQTVFSNVFKKKVDDLRLGIQLQSLATPLLAPMIEDGFFNKNISKTIIEEYLSDPALADIEALILACTHYPLIREEIEAYYQSLIPIIDSSSLVAVSIQQWLTSQNLLNKTADATFPHFYISDYTKSFEITASTFFGQDLRLEHYPLWE